MEPKNYSDYTLQQLYDVYRIIDNDKNPEEAKLLFDLIHEREKAQKGHYRLTANKLASPGQRFLAFLLDGLILSIPYFLIFMLTLGVKDFFKLYFEYGILFMFGYMLFFQLLYLSVNGWLLYKYGQTIGKKILNIKVVTLQGELPPFYSVYGLRYFANSFLSMVPMLGGLYYFVDILFIFSKDRRCLHDLISGTKVVPAG
jgi:uncharacterized RDD family membrane protein YckC